MPDTLSEAKKAWLERLGRRATAQTELDERDAQKQELLDKLIEAREKNMEAILEGMKITAGRPGEEGFETMQVHREDADQMKAFDVDDQRAGFRVANRQGTGIEGRLTAEQAKGQEEIDQAQFAKFETARRLLIEMTHEVSSKKVEVEKNGKKSREYLFSTEEMIAEVYDPLVRRGVPETFIGSQYSRTEKMLKGSFKAYGKRLEKSHKKAFIRENKDLGISLIRAAVAVPGAILTSIDAAKELASQLETPEKPTPIHTFQQNYGIKPNDSAAGPEMGDKADDLQKAVQSWAFIQNASDEVWDGAVEGTVTVVEGVKAVREARRGDREEEEEKHSAREAPGKKEFARNRAKLAPVLTETVISAASESLGKVLKKLGPAGSTIFPSVIQRSKLRAELAPADLKPANITAFFGFLADGIDHTLDQLVDSTDAVLATAKAGVRTALGQVDAAGIAKDLEDGKFEDAVAALNKGAEEAAKSLGTDFDDQYLKDHGDAMKGKASQYVTKKLKDALAASQNPEDDKQHKAKTGHDPDWVKSKSGPVCFACQTKSEDVKLFAGILEAKILQLKMEQMFFKLAVTVGGLGFDAAANFLAPLAMGGGLLRMSRFIFLAVRHWIDFHNFCNSKTAMMNAVSSYSPAVRRFRTDARNQGIHYSINAACEGVKIIGASLQCSPAVVGGIVAGQAASGAEAIEAVLYEINKRYQLEVAWQTYKIAIRNPANRRLGLIAIRENPTLAKYAIAWGAVVDRDPLVGDFMDYCGVNAETLKGNARIDKVVEYLEARMPDDITATDRRYDEDNSSWAPRTVKLTADCWIEAKTRGETMGGVQPADTTAIESAFTRYEAAVLKADDAWKSGTPEEQNAAVDAAFKCSGVVMRGLAKYRPKNAHGDSKEMEEVVALFRDRLVTQSHSLAAELKILDDALKPPPLLAPAADSEPAPPLLSKPVSAAI